MAKREATIEDLNERITAGEHVATLITLPGFDDLTQALDARARNRMKHLMANPVQESPAAYANELGYMRGLADVPKAAEQIIQAGREAEHAVRERETA